MFIEVGSRRRGLNELRAGTATAQPVALLDILALVRAPVVAVPAELRAEPAKRDVLEEGICRTDDRRRHERRIAVVVDREDVGAQQARPLEVDPRQAVRRSESRNDGCLLSIVTAGGIDHLQRRAGEELSAVGHQVFARAGQPRERGVGQAGVEAGPVQEVCGDEAGLNDLPVVAVDQVEVVSEWPAANADRGVAGGPDVLGALVEVERADVVLDHAARPVTERDHAHLRTGPRRHLRRRYLMDQTVTNKAGESRDPEVAVEWVESHSTSVACWAARRGVGHAVWPRREGIEAVREYPGRAETRFVTPQERAVALAARGRVEDAHWIGERIDHFV